ncbi:MAG TPA: protein phosphatase 2C domain-containing protein [Pyrinomonadaceae bacterium]|nr:protein phosphatase 2C domain-containing protein [Pyrinomonadaceae bacterium]
MLIRSEVSYVPKAGNTEEEYEDAFWPPVDLDQQLQTLKFAIADGATETSFASVWARLLVKAYCSTKFNHRLKSGDLADLRLQWATAVSSESLPWYAEEKLRFGAFSSLLGVTLHKRRDGSAGWRAIAVGDSCLFHIHNNRLTAAFPLDRSEAFNSRPVLLSSNRNYEELESSNIATITGELHVEDALYLMTDALACWFLTLVEAGKEPWKLKRTGLFERWIKSLREEKKIRNDDVTLVRIECISDEHES